jgi:hypothetical protein
VNKIRINQEQAIFLLNNPHKAIANFLGESVIIRDQNFCDDNGNNLVYVLTKDCKVQSFEYFVASNPDLFLGSKVAAIEEPKEETVISSNSKRVQIKVRISPDDTPWEDIPVYDHFYVTSESMNMINILVQARTNHIDGMKIVRWNFLGLEQGHYL